MLPGDGPKRCCVGVTWHKDSDSNPSFCKFICQVRNVTAAVAFQIVVTYENDMHICYLVQ